MHMVRKLVDNEFALRFKECLRDKGWQDLPQQELGVKLGVNQGMTGRYLAGTAKPTGANEERITTLLGVCCEWLRTGRGPKYPGRAEADILDMTGLTAQQKTHLRQTRDMLIGLPPGQQPTQSSSESGGRVGGNGKGS